MKRILVVAAFLGSASVAFATTPTVNNVGGTVSTGQILTISGINMVQEDNSSWINFFKSNATAGSFEGSSPSADGYSAVGPKGGTYVSDVKLLGNKSIRFHIGGASSNCPVGNLADYNAFQVNSDFYVRSYVRYNSTDSTWPNAHLKTFYAFPSSGYEQLVDVWSGGGSLPNGTNTYYDGYSHVDNFPSGQLQNNRWYCVEVYFKGKSPAHVTVWVDGVKVRDAAVSNASNWAYFNFGIPNACGTGSAFSLNNWWDGLALSTSRVYPAARVEISNNPTYGAGALKYQEPIYLSDGSIQIKADLSGLGTGPYYLWVTNNRQEQSSAYNLTENQAGGGDTQAPTIPANLTASAISSNQINLNWAASSDNTGVTGYKIYREGVYFTTVNGVTSFSNTGLAASTSYTYTVSAMDAAGNESNPSAPASATTQAFVITDSTRPSTPSGLSASASSPTQINLSWAASSDNVGVTGYIIYRGGVYLASTATTSYEDTSLTASTSYTYSVSAIDAAGNESSKSTAVIAITQNEATQGAALFLESFNDNNFSARGWYDNTNPGTIVTNGCYSGNCLQWAWASGQTKPTNGNSTRKQFTPTDEMYVSFYVKFDNSWRGSQQNYHPHLLYILSDLDDAANAYSGLSRNYLDTYIEFQSDVGSPYTIRPQILLQDALRVNSSIGTPPNNLSTTTENRSVTYCNTPVQSGVIGECYNDGAWETGNTWRASAASLAKDAWHHVEVYFKMNTMSGGKGLANGVMTEWIDGVKVLDYNNILYRTNQDATKKWAQFVLAPYIGDGSPVTQSMWIDELTLSTKRPGASSNAAPTSLGIFSVNPN